MAHAPLRPCSFPRCPVLVVRGRCRTHARQLDENRGTPFQRGYTTPAWRAFRAHWLKARPFCGDRIHGNSAEHSQCRADGRNVQASHVDHIEPIDGPSDRRFLDPAAVQSLCHRCHSRKTGRERNEKRTHR